MTINNFAIKVNRFLFLFIFCAFFSVNKLPVNPVYVISFPLVLVSFSFFNIKKVDKYQLLMYFYFILCLLGFWIGYLEFIKVDRDALVISSILYLYCILIGAQAVNVGVLTQREERFRVYRMVYNVLIFYMFLDLIIRLALSKGYESFYSFKWGFFYFDSNFSALIILLFLMFSIFLKINSIYDIGKLRFLLLIFLLVTTFSRAAIFAFIVSYLLLRYAKKIINYLSFLFLIVIVYIFYKMILRYMSGESFVELDGSFNSKFYIISVAIDNYQSLSWLNKVFGIGMANFPYFSNGIFAHNMLVTLVYEFGFFGITSFVLFLICSYKMIGKDSLYILVPFFIAGFSLFSAFMPFFFVLLACVYVETRSIKGLSHE